MSTIRECAENIANHLLTIGHGDPNHARTGDRLAVMEKTPGGEKHLGGYCHSAAVEAVEEELRDWLKTLSEEGK